MEPVNNSDLEVIRGICSVLSRVLTLITPVHIRSIHYLILEDRGAVADWNLKRSYTNVLIKPFLWYSYSGSLGRVLRLQAPVTEMRRVRLHGAEAHL